MYRFFDRTLTSRVAAQSYLHSGPEFLGQVSLLKGSFKNLPTVRSVNPINFMEFRVTHELFKKKDFLSQGRE